VEQAAGIHGAGTIAIRLRITDKLGIPEKDSKPTSKELHCLPNRTKALSNLTFASITNFPHPPLNRTAA
jgi:hypothetical protein